LDSYSSLAINFLVLILRILLAYLHYELLIKLKINHFSLRRLNLLLAYNLQLRLQP
ncbi:hypothetical protein GQ607_017927, partial [Colletotrichum asianum]